MSYNGSLGSKTCHPDAAWALAWGWLMWVRFTTEHGDWETWRNSNHWKVDCFHTLPHAFGSRCNTMKAIFPGIDSKIQLDRSGWWQRTLRGLLLLCRVPRDEALCLTKQHIRLSLRYWFANSVYPYILYIMALKKKNIGKWWQKPKSRSISQSVTPNYWKGLLDRIDYHRLCSCFSQISKAPIMDVSCQGLYEWRKYSKVLLK